MKTSIKGSDFIFDYVNLLHYRCHKINLNCNGSYIDSPDWIKNKKATIYLINDEVRCFQYIATVVISHERIGKNPQRLQLKFKKKKKLSIYK